MKYNLLNKIGNGTYGEVFEAIRENGEVIAIKRTPLEDNGISLQSLREIAILKKLDHPNIIKLLDVEYADTCVSMMLEKSGLIIHETMIHDLSQFIRMCEFEMERNMKLIKNILDAVCYLHKNNFQHRDIKPSNILVFGDAENIICKLADFGLSRKYGENMSKDVVTIWYRSPELLLGLPYSTPSDNWSVGAVISELYFRKALFPVYEPTPMQQLLKIVEVLGHFEGDYLDDLKTHTKLSIRYVPSQFSTNCNLMKTVRRFLDYNPQLRLSCMEALNELYA